MYFVHAMTTFSNICCLIAHFLPRIDLFLTFSSFRPYLVHFPWGRVSIQVPCTMHHLPVPWNQTEFELPRKIGNQTLPKDGKVNIFQVSMENLVNQSRPKCFALKRLGEEMFFGFHGKKTT